MQSGLSIGNEPAMCPPRAPIRTPFAVLCPLPPTAGVGLEPLEPGSGQEGVGVKFSVGEDSPQEERWWWEQTDFMRVILKD